MKAISVILIILGFLKVISGVDLITFAFLYFLISGMNFNLQRLTLFIFFAELFNPSIYGTYILSFIAVHFLFKRYRKFFHLSGIFDFCFFSLSFFLIRLFCNLPFILGYKVSAAFWVPDFTGKFIFVIILFWSQYWLEKCLARFIKLS